MKSLSTIGLALSVVFGCLLLALVAELYYLLWWKNRIVKTSLEDGYSNNKAREFCFMFCGKKPSASLNPKKSQEICSTDTQLVHEPTQVQLQVQVQNNVDSSNDFWFKPFGEDNGNMEDSELIGLCGPPRFLFTIKEETKEDLESEDGKSRGDNKSRKGSRSRSLSDLCLNIETPFLTPIASPPYFTPPLTPLSNSGFASGFNPFLESATDAEFNKFIRSSTTATTSPPPTFKFLKDAEDKFVKRFEVEKVEDTPSEEKGSFITLIFPKNNRETQCSSLKFQQQVNQQQLE